MVGVVLACACLLNRSMIYFMERAWGLQPPRLYVFAGKRPMCRDMGFVDRGGVLHGYHGVVDRGVDADADIWSQKQQRRQTGPVPGVDRVGQADKQTGNPPSFRTCDAMVPVSCASGLEDSAHQVVRKSAAATRQQAAIKR